MPSRHDLGRIGLPSLSSNSAQEPEFARTMPDDVTLQVARLPLRITENFPSRGFSRTSKPRAKNRADADVDAIVLAAHGTRLPQQNRIRPRTDQVDRNRLGMPRPDFQLGTPDAQIYGLHVWAARRVQVGLRDSTASVPRHAGACRFPRLQTGKHSKSWMVGQSLSSAGLWPGPGAHHDGGIAAPMGHSQGRLVLRPP
jgi:hypothetical protein